MKILTVDKMPCGVKIQLEDWSSEYYFMPKASTLAAYPVSQLNGEGQFSPKRGGTFRMAFQFDDKEGASQAFQELKAGNKTLLDFELFVREPWRLDFL